MPDDVTLIGLDFGTTTSSAVVANANLARSAVTGRMELSQVRERFRSEMVFTPLDEFDRLDEKQVERLLDVWLAAGAVRTEDVFGGGALLTGLTAQKQNAAALVRLVRQRLGNALIATADDPRLESWLAFMGNCAGLSRERPTQAILNLDVGGGTTNLALGMGGQVLRTGCLFVGARHVQVIPGSYRIVSLSRYARALMDHLKIGRGPGDTLTEGEVQAILDFYLALLETAANGSAETLAEPVAQLHTQIAFHRPQSCTDVVITFSGGVGELIYGHLQNKPWPPTTHFGDLGIDLAKRIVDSPVFAGHLQRYQPVSAGRATVYGLLRHSTEVSGSTLFLPRPELLPLTDVPILGSLNSDSTDEHLRDVMELVRHSTRGCCVQVAVGTHEASAVRKLGGRIASALRAADFPADQPLVLLMQENLGKVLGHYVTQWGTLSINLVVIDEVSVRDAQYVQIGQPKNLVVPVSFYGLNE
jgi:ethanolamine utilization protein EutA